MGISKSQYKFICRSYICVIYSHGRVIIKDAKEAAIACIMLLRVSPNLPSGADKSTKNVYPNAQESGRDSILEPSENEIESETTKFRHN
jgi:hypothetical protein